MNSDELYLGELVFDPSTRALTLKDGRPAPIRHKSKEVLLYLLANAGRTVTKDEVLDAVWSDVVVSDDSLVQCIADIRRVIGAESKEIIETVPREGYRLHVRKRAVAATGPVRRRAPLVLAGAIAMVAVAVWLSWPVFGPADTSGPATLTADVDAADGPPGTRNVEAYLEVLKGRASANLFDRDESLVAERHFRRAIDLDPTYARAFAELGTLFAVRFENDWTVLEQEDRDKALYYAETAVSLDPDLWLGHYALGRLQSVLGDYDKAEAHLRRAMALQPESEDTRAYFATVKIFQGDAQGALEILEPTVKSHPNPPFWYYLSLGNALYELGRTEEAETAFRACLKLAPKSPYCMRFQVAVYAELGRAEEARAARAAYEALGFDPSIEAMLALMWFQVPTGEERLKAAYRAIGLPP